MRLSGLHLLLTYQCTFECDHCFVWGSPWQTGTMTGKGLRTILAQARGLGTVEWIYFEGGEPFLYYRLLLAGVREAARLGFHVGVVSNAYWATDVEDARACLEPFAGLIHDLSISGDLYHGKSEAGREVEAACRAAGRLGIPAGVISICQPETLDATSVVGQLPRGELAVMYGGRAAEKLSSRSARRPGAAFTECPHEDLRDPDRVHVDPFGNVLLCSGISMGNLFETPLPDLCKRYRPEADPVTGALLAGGPAELARRHGIGIEGTWADACHLCDETRRALRSRYPDTLGPDQMYGVVERA